MEELDLASVTLASTLKAGSRASEPRDLNRMLVCVLPGSLLQKSAVVNLFFILTKFHEHDRIFYVKLDLDRSLNNFIGIPKPIWALPLFCTLQCKM